MEFMQYLAIRHTVKPGERQIKDRSAMQYNNRLLNLQRYNIYSGERAVTDQMLRQIHEHYKNTINEYQRTITYYIEFMAYREQQTSGSEV